MVQTQVRVVIFQDEREWIAQCLEHDICAQASTLDEVVYRFHLTIAAERDYAITHNRAPFEGIGQAPPHFHKLYENAGGTYAPSMSSLTNNVSMKLAA